MEGDAISNKDVRCVGDVCVHYEKSTKSGYISGYDYHVTGQKCRKTGKAISTMKRNKTLCPLKDMWDEMVKLGKKRTT